MKKILLAFAALLLIVSCSKEHDLATAAGLELYGYSDMQAGRTAFDTPTDTTIPLLWSAGDYVWLEGVKSSELNEGCQKATFSWNPAPTVNGAYHLYYNMTNAADPTTAYVLAEQTADGNLGNDGDFGHATADAFGSFTLQHKCAYIWFDTTTEDIVNNNLVSITVTAAEVNLAGKCTYNPATDSWGAVTEGSQCIVLNFGQEGVALQASNTGVFAAMVTLPAAISGKELTILYTFADGATYTETRTPTKDFEGGKARRIATTINADDLAPELDYELRVLSFEDDENKKFESFVLEYQGLEEGYWEINTWSDLIDTKQQDGDKLYAMAWYQGDQALYRWWDQNHTDLSHAFYESGWTTFAGGGHAISDYTEPEYYGDYLRPYLNKYYTDPSEYWGWQYLQLMTPIGAHSGKNFAVHYGYKDFMSMIEVLPSLEFAETGPHIIDHMYVTCTNYMLNQTIEGVSREDTDSGDQFGGNWDGLDKYDDAWLKIVARGYASKDDTEPCSSSEFYLVNGKDIVLDWRKWDLTELGMVEKVEFDFAYSEQMGGIYGFTIPAYFAYDDVVVRFEK